MTAFEFPQHLYITEN